MPILEKKGITVEEFIKERLPHAWFTPEVFERQCIDSIKNKEDFMIIDGTTMFTIPLSNLIEHYFAPTPETMDVAPIEAKPKPKPKAKKAKVKKK